MLCTKFIKKVVRSLFTQVPITSSMLLWAEESSALTSGKAEWSYGNGSQGNIGIPVPDLGTITSMSFHSNTYPSSGKAEIEIVDYQNTTPLVLHTFAINSSTDGSGSTNNAHKTITLNIDIPSGAVLGFKTKNATSGISNCRVSLQLTYTIGTSLKFIG